jgi:type IV pilus assembly protein PilB
MQHAADFSEDLSIDPAQALTMLESELALLGDADGAELDRLERLLTETRQATHADAGTVFLREGDTLRFVVVQNESLTRRLREDEMRRGFQGTALPIEENSLAGYVALRGEVLNIGDVYAIPAGRPFAFNPTFDVRHRYRTHSVMAVPIVGRSGETIGVLEMINALDTRGRIVPFDAHAEAVIRDCAERIGAVCPRPERLVDAVRGPEAPADTASQSPRPPAGAEASAVDPSIGSLVDTTLREGIRRGASGIHLEPLEQSLRIRYRIDGRLVSAMSLPKHCEAPMMERLKTLAGMDTSRQHLPQEGRITLVHDQRPIALRVSVVPMLFGDSMSLQVREGAVLQPNLAQIGLDAAGLSAVLKAIHQPSGVVLVTGPAGAGKTTTLYSAVHLLGKQELKVVTVEDPVEYALDGVSQVNVQEEVGRTFAATLRSFLHHDPDVIVVGELRDTETAQTAIRAGLTEHLVLSTLDTADGAATIARLLDMTVPPFLLASALRLLVAQRLVRRLCSECREPYEIDEESLIAHGHTPLGRGRCTIFRATGCAACDFKGRRGRVGIFEVMPITPDIADLILKNGTPKDIQAAAREHGMKTLREAGLLRVLEGVTSVEEVIQATSG